jgi:hypothetical protein
MNAKKVHTNGLIGLQGINKKKAARWHVGVV